MDLASWSQPSAAGLAGAVVAVVAGAPIFSNGLRALRLRRAFAGLAESRLDPGLAGLVHVSGRVSLESPLFTPLSSVPCAGFRLEVRAHGAPMRKSIEVRRPFRLGDGTHAVRVESERGRWALGVGAERDLRADQPMTEGLAALLGQAPEILWWRRAGGTLRLIEHALPAGAGCHAVGFARMARAVEVPRALEVLRTGTGSTFAAEAVSHAEAVPSLGAGEFLDFLWVSDHAPGPAELAVPAWRALGVALGPALSLFGMLYLAGAAEHLRSMGRF